MDEGKVGGYPPPLSRNNNTHIHTYNMKHIINIVSWFESKPSRIAYLFMFMIAALALAHVIDAQVALHRIITGQ